MTRAIVGAALGLCVVALVPDALRWVRVAQREHYLPGSASRFAWRWWTSRPVSAASALAAGAAAVASAFVAAAALVTAAAGALGPPGLGVRGRTARLRWTRRCTTLGAGVAVGSGALVGTGAMLGGARGALVASAAVVVAMPVVVDGVLTVLRPVEDRLARHFVEEAAERVARVRPTIVGVTGSYGKTSTKVYIAHLLAGRLSVVASPRSFNNRAGLARTVNELLVPGTDVLVAEMGAYGPGEIAGLCAWLPPKVAVLTAIGPVHLERFRTLERTVAAKSEITVGAEVVVVNGDDPLLAALADRLVQSGRRVVRCSALDRESDIAVLEHEGGLALYVSGRHAGTAAIEGGDVASARSNVACAAAVALELGCTPDEVIGRLGSLPPVANRLAPVRSPSGALVLDDTFNSNPAGAALALGELRSRSRPGGRRYLVTPGMVELGSVQRSENAALARAAAEVATDVIVVGRTNRRALVAGLAEARASGHDVAEHHVVTRDDAVALLRGVLQPEDVVLYENDLPDHFP